MTKNPSEPASEKRAWICSYLPASSGRGIERFVDALASLLRKHGYSVKIADAASTGIHGSLLCNLRPYVAWRVGQSVNRSSHDDDIIICNSYFSWNSRRRKSVAVYHQTERARALANKGKRNAVRNLAVMTIGSYLDRRCGVGRKVVAVSESVKEEIEELYGLEVDAVIPHAIDLDKFSPTQDQSTIRKRLGLPEERFLVLHAGPSDMQKGLGVVVRDILPRVRATHHFVLIVDTEERPEGTTVVGRVPFDAMADYIKACDALVMPSLYEGFGLTTAEALACGVPCVVSPTGIGRQLAADPVLGRYVIRPDNPEQYVQSLMRLQESREEWRRAAEASRSFAVDQFSPDRWERSFLDLIASLS